MAAQLQLGGRASRAVGHLALLCAALLALGACGGGGANTSSATVDPVAENAPPAESAAASVAPELPEECEFEKAPAPPAAPPVADCEPGVLRWCKDDQQWLDEELGARSAVPNRSAAEEKQVRMVAAQTLRDWAGKFREQAGTVGEGQEGDRLLRDARCLDARASILEWEADNLEAISGGSTGRRNVVWHWPTQP